VEIRQKQNDNLFPIYSSFRIITVAIMDLQ